LPTTEDGSIQFHFTCAGFDTATSSLANKNPILSPIISTDLSYPYQNYYSKALSTHTFPNKYCACLFKEKIFNLSLMLYKVFVGEHVNK
jgi:hypothetical protein